jgi:hypothetical protein
VRRALAGIRAARIRPVGLAAAGMILLAACGPAEKEAAFEAPATTAATATPSRTTSPAPSLTPTPNPTSSRTPAPTTVAARPTPSPTPVRVKVPSVSGLSAARAAARLAALGLRTRTITLRTADAAAGTVLRTAPSVGSRLAPGTMVTLTVAVAPPPVAPAPEPAGGCDPSYPDVCLKQGIGDYDCAGGSGNGPNYVDGPIAVRGDDPFDLDRDHDGVGCE